MITYVWFFVRVIFSLNKRLKTLGRNFYDDYGEENGWTSDQG